MLIQDFWHLNTPTHPFRKSWIRHWYLYPLQSANYPYPIWIHEDFNNRYPYPIHKDYSN